MERNKGVIMSFHYFCLRFVNFITEPYQTNLFAKAIKTIANEVRIYYWW